jgi:hypothetical protein
MKQTTRKHHYTITESAKELGIIAQAMARFSCGCSRGGRYSVLTV